MHPKDRKRITKVAELMLAEARSSDNDRVFSATGFARDNISIVHQQLRCANPILGQKSSPSFSEPKHSRYLGPRFDPVRSPIQKPLIPFRKYRRSHRLQ
jgi:hypothetical protein